MTSVTLLRAKQLVARHGTTIAAVLAVLGVVLVGVGAVEYATPPSTEVTESMDSQTIRSEVHTNITASGDTPLYDAGTALVDEPIYLFASSPTVTVRQRTSVPADQAVDVRQNITLRYQLSRDGKTYWTDARVLAANDTTTSTGTAVTTASLNVRTVKERVAKLRKSAGQTGVVDAHLVVSTTYNTAEYSGSVSEKASLTVLDGGYRIDRPTAERTHSRQRARRVAVPTRDALPYLLPLGTGSVLLVAAAGVAAGQRRRFDSERIESELATRRYREWISAGTLPGSPDGTVVDIDSLADLVDTAIDTDSRVVYDEAKGVYAVLDGPVVYRYSPGEDD